MSGPGPSSRPADPGLVTLTIRPEPCGPDHLGRCPMTRLRGLLKVTLRAFGWRCIRIDTAARTCAPYETNSTAHEARRDGEA